MPIAGFSIRGFPVISLPHGGMWFSVSAVCEQGKKLMASTPYLLEADL
jgi:hypothetical protein